MKNMRNTANALGIISIQCDRISGKNSSDLKMTIDILKTLFTIDHISLFYIITSDSDFRHVIAEIKTHNKYVHCISNSNCNSSIQAICDVFTKMETLRAYTTIDNNQELDVATSSYSSAVKKNVGSNNSSPVSSRLLSRSSTPPPTSRSSSPPLSRSGVVNNLGSKVSTIDILSDIKRFFSEKTVIDLGIIRCRLVNKYSYFDHRDYGCKTIYI